MSRSVVDPISDVDPGSLFHFSQHYEIGHFTIFHLSYSGRLIFIKLDEIIDTSKRTVYYIWALFRIQIIPISAAVPFAVSGSESRITLVCIKE